MPIFQDHFIDNRNNWPEREEDFITQKVEEVVFSIDRREDENYSTVWREIDIKPGTDYKVHAVIELISGGRRGFGLIWRGTDKDNCFAFEVSGEGYYRVKQRVEGKWSPITDWEPSKQINIRKGINAIMVKQTETSAHFLINGEEVHTSVIPRPSVTNGIGFVLHGRLQLRIHSVLAIYTGDSQDKVGPASEEDLQAVLDELNQLIGLENIKQEINTLVNVLKVQKLREEREMKTTDLSLHMVLAGPPGTGKTTVARLIGKIYHALGFLSKGHVVETDRAGLVAQYVGQTAPKVDEKVQEAMGGILFVDEAYALMPKESGSRDFGQEAIEALLKRMEDYRGEFALVIAGYDDEMHRFLDANPGVRSRFNRYLYFDHYNPAELTGIFELFVRKGGYELEAETLEVVKGHMAQAYARRDNAFGNGRYARNLFEDAIEKQANRIVAVEMAGDEITDEMLVTFAADDIPPYQESELDLSDLERSQLTSILDLQALGLDDGSGEAEPVPAEVDESASDEAAEDFPVAAEEPAEVPPPDQPPSDDPSEVDDAPDRPDGPSDEIKS